jgi:predicted ArsR family transcriptional regulator
MTNTEKILKTLNFKYAKDGLTAAQIAERASLSIGSARTVLYELNGAGTVARKGVARPEGRGRPAYLYVVA